MKYASTNPPPLLRMHFDLLKRLTVAIDPSKSPRQMRFYILNVTVNFSCLSGNAMLVAQVNFFSRKYNNPSEMISKFEKQYLCNCFYICSGLTDIPRGDKNTEFILTSKYLQMVLFIPTMHVSAFVTN